MKYGNKTFIIKKKNARGALQSLNLPQFFLIQQFSNVPDFFQKIGSKFQIVFLNNLKNPLECPLLFVDFSEKKNPKDLENSNIFRRTNKYSDLIFFPFVNFIFFTLYKLSFKYSNIH